MGYYIAVSVGALIGFATALFLFGINGRASSKRLNTGEIKGLIDDSGRCVVCNAEIPEGRQVCPRCERKE